MIPVIHMGTVEYQECLLIQQNIHQRVVNGEHGGCFLVVEHPPVITLGNRADKNSILANQDFLSKIGIHVVPTDRGGDVTAHEPGQLVIYPILSLVNKSFGPRFFVEALQQAVIDWLSFRNIHASVDHKNPGVWVGNQKICALGVRFKNRATYHGLAINMNNSLKTFQWIVPCGLYGKGVTSVNEQTGHTTDLKVAAEEITNRIGVILESHPQFHR